MLRLENITKIFATDLVLKNINWEIKKGEKIGLIGSNGAGKTTLFNALTGFVNVSKGKIVIFIDEEWLEEISDDVLGFQNKTFKEMIEH